jgi:hypothetical protein
VNEHALLARNLDANEDGRFANVSLGLLQSPIPVYA